MSLLCPRRQVYLAYSFTTNVGPLQRWKIYAAQLFTVFSYANSAINPVIYGFTNDLLKKSFRNVFGCQRPSARRGDTVSNGVVSTRPRYTQCRPSRRRRVMSLSGRPNMMTLSIFTKRPTRLSPRLRFVDSYIFAILCLPELCSVSLTTWFYISHPRDKDLYFDSSAALEFTNRTTVTFSFSSDVPIYLLCVLKNKI